MFRILFSRDTWQEIFGSIGKNKLRTVITIIGVLWGIFVYIALSGAAKGLDNGFDKVFKDIATNSLFLWSQNTSMPYEGFKIGRRIRLKVSDGEYLKKKFPEISFIAPRNQKGDFGNAPPRVVRGLKSGSYTMYADYPSIDKISKKKIYDGGRFINDEDIAEERKVVVIGERIKSDLFEKDEDAIGQFIEIDEVYFQVVGVYKIAKGASLDGDETIFMPFTTFRTMYNTADRVSWFAIAAHKGVNIVKLEKQIKAEMRRLHKVNPKDERAFGSVNFGEEFKKIDGFAKGINLLSLIVGIATIFAGVIAIGNILLISVKERTKELGVRRALGATPGEVRAQIVLESVFLTIISGFLGIILGAITLYGLNKITANMDDIPYANPTVPIPFVLGALIIIVVLGTLIGMIPAQRAVSIKPIDALREE